MNHDFNDLSRYFHEVTVRSREMAQNLHDGIAEVMGSLQYQDVSRQQIDQVKTGLDEVRGFVSALDQALDSGKDVRVPEVRESLAALRQGYVMQSQHDRHDAVLGAERVGGADNARPAIELF